ncbi:hypothetical protein OESDEN_09999 [Oesophagostomum dentatum]|uniref:Uncharacterized protein n=1 Tax=Oesophagostomum dentatum TaxID=61180 RepID=A0A0B1T324_OESDE|nr:hypothetical protein OESDEN_09999 [Oesophagostomum dentatum]
MSERYTRYRDPVLLYVSMSFCSHSSLLCWFPNFRFANMYTNAQQIVSRIFRYYSYFCAAILQCFLLFFSLYFALLLKILVLVDLGQMSFPNVLEVMSYEVWEGTTA